ncbi:MAG: hypothetical protein OEM39_04750 [Acidimicrobiia bacterium]|nr:hypothetical protein [Acidimicrobiia bacterium]
MTVDLERQLREYASHVTDLSEPVDVDALVAEPAEGVHLRPQRLKPGWSTAAIAAVILLVVIGGVALGFRPFADDSAPVITQPGPTTTQLVPETTLPPTTTVTATTLPSLVEGPMTWSRMPFDGQVRAVAAGDSGLIAAGSSNFTTTMWRSSDGKTWTPIPLDRNVFGGYRISHLVAHPDGYTAVGSDGETAVVTWTSPDGLEWIRNPVEGFEPEEIGRLVITALTDGPSGLVAVGWTTSANPNLSGLLEDHVVIHSSDRTVWQRADTADLPLGGMKDVTAGGPGYVAVGVDWSDRSNSRPGVWTSADGLNWTLIDGANVEGGPGHDAGMERLEVADDGRLYAFGLGPVWVSEDGSTWSRIGDFVGEPEDGFAEAWSGWANAGVFSGERVVLAGGLEFRGGAEADRAAAWASEDGGRTWERMSQPPDVFGDDHGESEMDQLAEVDGTYVAFGQWDGERSVWVGAWNEER